MFVPIKPSATIRHSVPVMLLAPAVVLVKLPGWVMVGTRDGIKRNMIIFET